MLNNIMSIITLSGTVLCILIFLLLNLWQPLVWWVLGLAVGIGFKGAIEHLIAKKEDDKI